MSEDVNYESNDDYIIVQIMNYFRRALKYSELKEFSDARSSK